MGRSAMSGEVNIIEEPPSWPRPQQLLPSREITTRISAIALVILGIGAGALCAVGALCLLPSFSAHAITDSIKELSCEAVQWLDLSPSMIQDPTLALALLCLSVGSSGEFLIISTSLFLYLSTRKSKEEIHPQASIEKRWTIGQLFDYGLRQETLSLARQYADQYSSFPINVKIDQEFQISNAGIFLCVDSFEEIEQIPIESTKQKPSSWEFQFDIAWNQSFFFYARSANDPILILSDNEESHSIQALEISPHKGTFFQNIEVNRENSSKICLSFEIGSRAEKDFLCQNRCASEFELEEEK